jgi:hypothetical protein
MKIYIIMKLTLSQFGQMIFGGFDEEVFGAEEKATERADLLNKVDSGWKVFPFTI